VLDGLELGFSLAFSVDKLGRHRITTSASSDIVSLMGLEGLFYF
jgi:hypothetical protein